jgi:hypothetical protein
LPYSLHASRASPHDYANQYQQSPEPFPQAELNRKALKNDPQEEEAIQQSLQDMKRE